MATARIYHSPLPNLPIPIQSVPSFIFSSGTPESRRQPQYFDAEKPSRNFSLAEAESLVKRIGKGLQELGLKPDDKVLLYAGNSLWFPVLLWGTVASGCVFTGCSPSASASELAYQLKDSEAKLLVTGSACFKNALEAARQVGLPRSRVYEFLDPEMKPSSSSLQSWTQFWASEEQSRRWRWREFRTKEEAAETTAVINYSSGTTGLPKGVEISHYNLVANSEQVLFKRNMVANTPEGRARKARLDSSGDRWLAPLPMFHAYGQTYYCMSAARCGAKVFIMPKYEMTACLTYLDIYRITTFTGVPALMLSLCKHPDAGEFNLNAIESAGTGSAPLDPQVSRMLNQRLLKPGVIVKQGWGMTECTCSATSFAADDEDDGRSIGWLNPNIIAKIVPVPDREFEADAKLPYPIGEIWISGPNVMRRYYKKPEATAETIAYEDGHRWLKTGDIGYVDNRGRLFIIDRLKELIKVKGLQVAPAELEGTLQQHPDVLDAAVVGLKIGNSEYPKAYVVKKREAVTSAELQTFVQERLSKHKWLTGGIEFIETIPRTASGKVIRRALPQGGADMQGTRSKL